MTEQDFSHILQPPSAFETPPEKPIQRSSDEASVHCGRIRLLEEREQQLHAQLIEKMNENEKITKENEKTKKKFENKKTELLSIRQKMSEILDEQARLRSLNESLQAANGELTGERVELTEMVEKQKRQTEALRKYIGQPNQQQQFDKFRLEQERLLDELAVNKARVKSLEKIVEIEESSLGDAHGSTQLLSKWRRKVFELLVQLQSGGMAHERDMAAQSGQLRQTADRLTAAQRETSLAQARLQDVECQLKLTEAEAKSLRERLASAEQSERGQLEAVCAAQQQWRTLHQQCVKLTSMEHVFTTTLDRVAEFENRIGFAAQRVGSVESSLQCQREMARTVAALQQELARCREENAFLQSTVDARVQEAIKKDKASMEERTMRLENELALWKAKEEDTARKLAERGEELQRLGNRVEDVEQAWRRSVNEVEADWQQRWKDREGEHREQIVAVEMQHDATRRELEKLSVQHRQLQRRHETGIAKFEEERRDLEAKWQNRMGQLERNVADLERDRGLLMSIVRQEGLVDQWKRGRKEPRTPSPTKFSPVKSDASASSPTRLPPVALKDLIGDIKSLAAQVLSDE